MTSDRTQGKHPTELELAVWVDEQEARATAFQAHVESCDRCGERIAELEATRAALALDPPMPSDAAFAAQREQILAAIGAVPHVGLGGLVRRIGWLVPLAAAAAIAAIVLIGPTDREPRTADGGGETTVTDTAPASGRAPLPVVANAEDAAEDAAAVVGPVGTSTTGDAVAPSEPIDEDALDAALAAAEPLAPPIAVERTATLESEFAALSEEDQSAVLVDLASADFDL